MTPDGTPDNLKTTYTYTYVPNTQTAKLGTATEARFKKTTLDGFGRVTRVNRATARRPHRRSTRNTPLAPARP